MPDRAADVLVIGAGAVGAYAAYYLRRSGASVAIVDRGGFGRGCSLGNAGLLVPSHMVPLAAPGVIAQGLKWMLDPESPFYIRPRLSLDLFSWLWNFRRYCTEEHVRRCVPVLRDLLRAGRDLARQVAVDEGLEIEFRRDGLLVLSLEEGLSACRHESEIARSAGMPAVLYESGEAVNAAHASLGTIARGGIFFPEDAQLHPARHMEGLEVLLRRLGVEIFANTAVENFALRDGRVEEVVTSKGTIRAREVVLAAGSWTPAISRRLGLDVPIQPGKGYSLTVPKPAGAPPCPLILSEARVAITPFCDELRVSGTMELSGWNLDVNERRVRAILRAVPRYLPSLDLSAAEPAKAWAGLRPCTPDGLPMVGRAPGLRNVTLASGHAMLGIALAAVSGKIVSELIEPRPPSIDPSPLAPDRFRKRRVRDSHCCERV